MIFPFITILILIVAVISKFSVPLAIAVGILYALVWGSIFYMVYIYKTPEEVEKKRMEQEAIIANFRKLLEGTKVKILEEGYDYPEFHGIIIEKSSFNIYEAGLVMYSFTIDLYRNGAKVSTKVYDSSKLEAV